MFEFFTISDWIQFIGVMVSFAVGIASIIIAVITLRQNSKMIAESTRPYIVVQFERAYTSTFIILDVKFNSIQGQGLTGNTEGFHTLITYK